MTRRTKQQIQEDNAKLLRDKAEMNPYKIFQIWQENGRQMRRIVSRFDSMTNCMKKLADIAEREDRC